jgi:hypothetical protein
MTLEPAYDEAELPASGCKKIWNATEPKPFPPLFDDFRQSVIERFWNGYAKKIRVSSAKVLNSTGHKMTKAKAKPPVSEDFQTAC